jgi:uncharacterized repeat protein (TIGR03803 family)
MKIRFTSTETQPTTLNNGSRACAMIEPALGRKPVLALFMRLLWAAALVVPPFGAEASVVFTNLHSFQSQPNGANPWAPLVQGSDGNFYGTTSGGGTNGGNGTVFRISANGALTTLYSFTGINDGASPNALVQGRDGDFYGTTEFVGKNGYGTVFKISTNGTLTTLYSFTGSNDGWDPQGGLVQGSDGSFYGTTQAGGKNGFGTVFKMSTSGALTSLYSFSFVDGAYPQAGLVQGSDGNFYGTTYNGGTSRGVGTVFKMSPNGALTTLYSFTVAAYGAGPTATLVQGSDGNFYGTTDSGGTGDSFSPDGYGTVFKISTNGALTSLHSFAGFVGGGIPSGLVQGADGNFYGTTHLGATYGPNAGGYGTVFKMSTNGALTSLYAFIGTKDGAFPGGGLVQGSDGNLYGTTENGGTVGDGTVFKISTNGALTSLYAFGTDDGGNPQAVLVQGSDGNFYGTTANGGTNNAGTVFRISANGTLTSLYSFTGTNDGANPQAGLVQGSDGNFYGTTFGGGAYTNQDGGLGTVFKISTSGGLTSLYSFAGGNDGAGPLAGLVQGSDGSFYGTTVAGGAYTNQYGGLGTVFKISANGALTSLYSFTGGKDGASPQAALVQGSDGNVYGTTFQGGAYTNQYGGLGTVFKISTNGVLTTLHSFSGFVGEYPIGLVQGTDGNFYGTTRGSPRGTSYGTVFKISTNGSLTSLYSFTGGNDGASPAAGLVQGSDGSFYGTTYGFDYSTAYGGGQGGAGTIFRLTIVPEFQAVTLTNGALSLTWSTEAGGTYQPQFSSDLSSGNWTSLGSAVTAAGATLSAMDSVTNGPRRFYRVVLSP